MPGAASSSRRRRSSSAAKAAARRPRPPRAPKAPRGEGSGLPILSALREKVAAPGRGKRAAGAPTRTKRPRPPRAPKPGSRRGDAAKPPAGGGNGGRRSDGAPPGAPPASGPRRRRLPRVPPKAVAVVLGLVVLLVPIYLVVRDSSLVEVRDVYITGLRSEQRDEIRSELRDAALGMTTLHVDHGAFDAIARRYPSIAAIRTDSDLPHGLTIEVVERVPVGLVGDGRDRLPVTASGVVLKQLDRQRDLPRVDVGGPVSGGRVSDHDALAAIGLLAAAPPELRERVARARLTRSRGFVLDLRNGTDLIFGAADDLEAKWAAAARVLADASAHGASAIDVRIPERPAAAGVAAEEEQAEPTPGAGGGEADVSPQTSQPDPPSGAAPTPTATPTPTPPAADTPPATGQPLGTAPTQPTTPGTP